LRHTKPSMVVHSNQLKFKTGKPSLRANNARSAKPRINTCITTMAKNDPNCSARPAHQLLTPTIVIKEQLKLNIIVRIATVRYSAGKYVSTSLCTNVATITARTESTLSNNSTPQNALCDNQNLLNSNSVTFTANIYLKLRISPSLRHLSQPSTSEKFIIHLTYSDLSSRSSSPSP